MKPIRFVWRMLMVPPGLVALGVVGATMLLGFLSVSALLRASKWF